MQFGFGLELGLGSGSGLGEPFPLTLTPIRWAGGSRGRACSPRGTSGRSTRSPRVVSKQASKLSKKVSLLTSERRCVCLALSYVCTTTYLLTAWHFGPEHAVAARAEREGRAKS